MHKDTLKLNRPIYVGMSILDLIKNLMFDFYYNQLKKQYSCCNLLYTDTDSFILRIEQMMFIKTLKVIKTSIIQVIITTNISCLATRIKKSLAG